MKKQSDMAGITPSQIAFTVIITLIGAFGYAASINLFFVPQRFLSGGLTGIAMILYYLWQLPIGVTNLVLNIPILFLALRYMGKYYTFTTILGTAAVSIFIDLTHFMVYWHIVNEPLVSAIAGGCLMGVSTGLLFRYNSNTGGLDVIGAVIKKFYSLEIGNVVFAINFIIVMSSAYIFSLELAICTLVAMYICANLSNRIVIGFAQRKAAFIVSEKPNRVADTILRNIRHGATLLYGQGSFSGQNKRILFAIVDLTQITRLRHLIEDEDPHAFLFIMNTTDVIGRGFTSPLAPRATLSPRYRTDEDGNIIPTEAWKRELERE